MDVLDKYLKILEKHDFESKEKIASEDGILVKEEFSKVAEYKLPNNVSEWNKEIIKQLHNNREWLDVDNFYVRWKSNFDGEKGYGLGVIVLVNNDTEVSIPVIVKNYTLQPFDVFIGKDNKKIMPLTESNINKEFFDTGIAEEAVEKKKRNASPISDVFPPRMGKYIYASIDISEDEQADFYARLNNKNIKAAKHENGSFEEISTDILEKEPKKIQRYFNEKEKKAFLISPDDKLGYKTMFKEGEKLKTKVASFYDTLTFIKEAADIEENDIKETLKKVDKGKEVIINQENDIKSVSDEDIQSLDIREADSSGKYLVQDKHGNELKGYVIPKVYSYQTGKLDPSAVLIDDERNILSYQPRIVGIPQGGGSLKNIKIKNVIQMPTRDSVISFMWYDNNFNDYVVTQPAKIIDYMEVEGLGKVYNLMTTFGSYHKVALGKDIMQPDFSQTNKHNAIILPEESSLLMVERNTKDLVDDVSKFKKGLKKQGSVIKAEYFKNSNEIKTSSKILKKTASPNEIRMDMIEKGFALDRVNSFIKEAMQKNKSELLYIPYKEKQASLKNEIYDRMVNDIGAIKDEYDLVKIAAYIDNKEIVDKVLSLNFMNKTNLAHIYEYLPEIKDTVEKLAEMTLFARLGEIGVSEEAIVQAMKSLQDLVEKMEGYKI